MKTFIFALVLFTIFSPLRGQTTVNFYYTGAVQTQALVGMGPMDYMATKCKVVRIRIEFVLRCLKMMNIKWWLDM